MDLFRLVGTIAVNNSEANESITETSGNAESMASTLGDKFSSSGKSVDNIREKLASAGKSISNVGDKFSSAGTSITNVGKKFAPVSALVVGAGTALVGLATKTASTTDNIDKMSQKMGISRTAYQEWDYVLSQNGASVDSLKMGMKTLNGIIDNVAVAGATQGTAFERLGIKYDDLQGKSQEDIFGMTIEALQNCTDETERTALANDLLGRSGMELAPLLNSGAESTEALKQKAHDLGLVLDDETINAGVAMTDAVDTMKRSFISVGGAIATAVMPLLTRFATYVASNLPAIREKINSLVQKFNELSPTIKKIIAVVAGVLAVASPVLIVVGKLVSGVGGIITKVGGAITKISSLSSGLGGLSSVLGAIISPVGLVVIAIAALIAVITTLWNTNEEFRTNITAIWNDIAGTFTEFGQGIVDRVNSLGFDFENFGELIKAVWFGFCDVLAPYIEGVFKFISIIVETYLDMVLGVVDFFIALFKGDWEGCFDAIESIVTAYLSGLAAWFGNIFDTILGVTDVFLGWFGTSWSELWSSVSEFVINAWNTITNAIQVAIMFIGSLLSTAFQIITLPFALIWENCKGIIITIWDAIISEIKARIAIIAQVINAIRAVIEPVFNAIKASVSIALTAIKGVVDTVLGAVQAKFDSIWNSIKSKVTAVVNDIKSNISTGLNGAKGIVSSVLDSIKSKFDSAMTSASEKVRSAIAKIKGYFNFSWSLPKLKMPHFSISGGFKLDPPSAPKFGVEWYKDGGIMTEPTLFGYNPLSNKAMVGGEAGAEAIVPIDKLQGYVSNAVSSQNLAIVEVLNMILQAIYNLDDGIGDKLFNALLAMKFEINNREFARLVKAV